MARQTWLASPPLTRREVLMGIWLSGLVITLIITVIGMVWYSHPITPYVSIGNIDDFAIAEKPTPYFIHQGDFRAWVVRTPTELVVFHPRTPEGNGCAYKWLPLDRTFVDPCTGSSFYETGQPARSYTNHYLDQYAYRIVDDYIQIETWRIIRGGVVTHPRINNAGLCIYRDNGTSCGWP